MTVNLIQILNDAGNSLVREIQSRIPQATGSSAKSMRVNVTIENNKYILKITAKPYFMVLETGRKPTPGVKPSRGMVDNIKEWLKAKGKEESLAWAISKSINEKGTKLWQQGGRRDVVTEPIDRMLPFIEKAILEDFAKAFATDVKSQFNVNGN